MNGEFNSTYDCISKVITPYLESINKDISEIKVGLTALTNEMKEHNIGSQKYRLSVEKRLSKNETNSRWHTWGLRILFGGLISALIGFIGFVK